jgi:hypothetical protein
VLLVIGCLPLILMPVVVVGLVIHVAVQPTPIPTPTPTPWMPPLYPTINVAATIQAWVTLSLPPTPTFVPPGRQGSTATASIFTAPPAMPSPGGTVPAVTPSVVQEN